MCFRPSGRLLPTDKIILTLMLDPFLEDQPADSDDLPEMLQMPQQLASGTTSALYTGKNRKGKTPLGYVNGELRVSEVGECGRPSIAPHPTHTHILLYTPYTVRCLHFPAWEFIFSEFFLPQSKPWRQGIRLPVHSKIKSVRMGM